MDRTEYLNLCKKVSELPHIPDDCLVEYEGGNILSESVSVIF